MISAGRRAAFLSLLNRKPNFSCQKEEDERLAERIFFGTIQHERLLDDCLQDYARKPLQRLKPQVLVILRMSVYQILFLDRIPHSAVINDAANLCRECKSEYAAGLVNALLRKVSSNRDTQLSKPRKAEIRYSHPDWISERLVRDFGEETALAFMEANESVPDLRLQINTNLLSLEEFCIHLDRAGIEILDRNEQLHSVLVRSMSPGFIPGYEEGFFYVQDDAARTAVYLCEPLKGLRLLDACAAPGGKSCAASIAGASVLACDISEERLQRCRENFERLHLSIPIQKQDASCFFPDWQDSFHIVLADVPCSGTGIIRKHPEIREKKETDLLSLLDHQKKILRNLSRYVKPGGVLLYSTCSVLCEENEEQVKAFLTETSAFSLREEYRSWPHINGNDGFYAAKLQKEK